MSINYFDSMKEYIMQNIEKRNISVYIEKKHRFFGIKFSATDRFYLCFLSFYENNLTLTYRKNCYEREVIRVVINQDSLADAMELIDKVIDENVKIYFYNVDSPSHNEYSKHIHEGAFSAKKSHEEKLSEYIYNITIEMYSYDYSDEDYERYVEFNNQIEELVGTLLNKVCKGETGSRNAEIYRQRMELTPIDKNTLEAIASGYNITRERVRQIVGKINKRLKRYKDEFIILINSCERKDLLNYFFDGICKVHSHIFLKTIFEVIGETEIYNTILSCSEKIEKRIWLMNNEISAQNRVYSSINFPQKNVIYSIDEFEKYEIERHINEKGHGISGEFTLNDYDGTVEFESLLEKRIISVINKAYYAKRIKTQSVKIEYVLNGVLKSYYPDIQLLTTKNQIIIIECKPIYEMGCTINLAKYDALKSFCNERGYGYLMIDDRYNTIETIEGIDVPIGIERAFLELLNQNSKVDYAMIKKFRIEHNIKSDFKVIMKLIIKYREILTYSVRPFSIRMKRMD